MIEQLQPRGGTENVFRIIGGIIVDPVTKQAIVVDPGGAHERILREVQQLGLTVTHILHTHAHFDHFLASGEMKKATGAAICLHQDDLEL